MDQQELLKNALALRFTLQEASEAVDGMESALRSGDVGKAVDQLAQLAGALTLTAETCAEIVRRARAGS